MGDPAKKDDVQCLTDDVIHQFLTGELDDEQDQLVADHLEHCGPCQRLTMSFLSVDDLCLPWLKASDRDTIELGGKVADTVTISRLEMTAQTGDGPDQVAVPQIKALRERHRSEHDRQVRDRHRYRTRWYGDRLSGN
jgi:anti-sigma factor RsiW